MTKQLSDQVAAMEVLTNQLAGIRAYLKVGTAEELSAALAAGHSVPITEADLAAAKEKAIERAKAHRA